MFRSERDSSTVNFYLDGDDNDCKACWQQPVDFVPRVGDKVSILSSRDEHGNYMNDGRPPHAREKYRDVLEGTVVSVEHTFEERGRNSREHSYIQFVNVYLRSKL